MQIRNHGIVYCFATVGSLLALWEGSSHLGLYNAKLFPPPSVVAAALVQMVLSGEWLRDILRSMVRYAAGLAIGGVAGVGLGLLTGRSRVFYAVASPLLNFLRSTPSVALLPLAIVWFGVGDAGKVFVVAWAVTFPIWLNTHAGIREVEPEYLWAAQSLGATGLQLYREVYLPRAIPHILTGMRMAIATAFFALAAAEMIGTFGGIAFRIFYSHQMFRTDKMMVAILTIGMLSYLFDRLFVRVARWRIRWWVGDSHGR